MADPATRDDVQRAVKDGLNDVKNDISRMRDAVERIEQQTDDLDRSREEMKRLIQLEPHILNLSRKMDEVHGGTSKIDRMLVEINELKSQFAVTSQYLQQVARYLQALDERQRQDNDAGYRKV